MFENHYHLIVDELFLPRYDVVVDVVGISPRVEEVGERLFDQPLNDGLIDVELFQVVRVALRHPRRVEYIRLYDDVQQPALVKLNYTLSQKKRPSPLSPLYFLNNSV